MENTEEQRETYLGDGLYASFDGYQITLRAPRGGGDHWVALDPLTYVSLRVFAQRCWVLNKQLHSDV